MALNSLSSSSSSSSSSTLEWLATLPAELQTDIAASSSDLISPLRALRHALDSSPLADKQRHSLDSESPLAAADNNDVASTLNLYLTPLAKLLSAFEASPLSLKWSCFMTKGDDPILRQINGLRMWLLIERSKYPSSPKAVSCCRILRAVQLDATADHLWHTLFDIFSPAQPLSSASKHKTPVPLDISSVLDSSSVLDTPGRTRIPTPIQSSAGCSSLGTETHKDLDPRIRRELDGMIYPNTPGFMDAYFFNQEWSPSANRLFDRAKQTHLTSTGWTTWPPDAEQDDVLLWFTSCVNDLLTGTNRQYGQSPNTPFPDSNRKPDIFLCDGTPRRNEWSNVLVVGELKKSHTDTLAPALIVELANYVRLIFYRQHYRRFVHAFTLCGDAMRCWIFHRGGAFTSDSFSINRNPELFVRVVAGYALMSRADLGYDPTVTVVAETGLYVTVPSTRPPNLGSALRFDLNPVPVFRTPAIACRGTTCWEAKLHGEAEFKYVCKDAWRSDSYTSEGDLLLEAQNAGVQGLVEYISHQDIQVESVRDDISGNIMKGLKVGEPLNLRPTDSRSTAASTAPFTSLQSQRPSRPSSEPQKRSLPETPRPLGSNKRSKTSRASKASKSLPPGPSFNRVHTRLITSRGRPITEFTSNLELLHAFRDAIAGHRSLFRHGILHRDISINNIMITVLPRADHSKGFLIDLDLAIRLNELADSTTHHRTGTMEFMAIGALIREAHTYRHDLESFFYVFVWICILRRPGGGLVKPAPTVLAPWGGPSYRDAAERKRGNMDPGGFEILVGHFSESARELGPLACALREVLFPWRGRLWTGTDEDPEPVYEEVLRVVERAIAHVGGRSTGL